MAELDDGGGLDGEVGVDAYGVQGVELNGVEGGVAEAGGGAGGDDLLELLLEGGGGLGGERRAVERRMAAGRRRAESAGAGDCTHSGFESSSR